LSFFLPASREPKGPQPEQMKSPVRYDASLSDPFFEADEWSYPWWANIHDDGKVEDLRGEVKDIKDVPRLKHTAKCRTNHFYDHIVRYCDARKTTDDSLELYFHDMTVSTDDNLKVIVKGGKFSCRYWTAYFAEMRGVHLTWITKKQELVLGKKEYEEGDIIKGKIEFECIEKRNGKIYSMNNTPYIIKIKGVFKTPLE